MARNAVMEKDVVIVGAGIGGLATAVALKRVGIDEVLVLERADELRTTGAALSLFPNAWLALDVLGVSHKLTPLYNSFSKGFVTNVSTGAIQQLRFPPSVGEGKGLRAVHRKKLLEALAQELPKDWIRFSSKLFSIDNQEEGGASLPILHLEDGTTIKSKVLIGCDGVHSVVANWLGLAPAVHSGRSAVRGLSVFPEGHGSKHEVQQFVDAGKRAGVIPLNDTEFYWFMSCQSPPQETKMEGNPELMIQREILDDYAKDFPDVYLDVVRHADISTLSWAPLVFRYPWQILLGNFRKGNVTVAGDAMHPMTPDLGQGGCCALEDAVVLGRHIGNSFIRNGNVLVPKEIPGAIDGYIKERRWRATLMVTGSYLSGWAQQGGSNWWKKFLRDSIFYKYIFLKFVGLSEYNCGKLPTVSHLELEDHSRKKD